MSTLPVYLCNTSPAHTHTLSFMVPVSCVNALLKYVTRELSLGLRERLTAHLQARLVSGTREKQGTLPTFPFTIMG